MDSPRLCPQRDRNDCRRPLTDAAFHVRGISHVEIHVDKSNDVSLAIPRKLGYRLIAEESVEPVAPNELGLRCIWRLTREEWRSRGGMP